MPGRHRQKKTANWKLPTGIGAALAAGLVVTFWAVSVPERSAEPIAYLTVPSNTSRSQVLRPITTTTAPPAPQPPPVTTAPPLTTTTTTAPKTKATPPASSCPTTLDGVKPHVAQVGNHLAGRFDVDDIGGVAGRGGASDHPAGLALDFTVDTTTGDTLAEYVLANRRAFGVNYVIWRQRYNDGSGWSAMEDRGSPTANHMDHVHVSFRATATVKVTC
ncbi:hypothetical protein [Actinophytocola sp.]|uniref:hypothetical protein n=1 Tax=Actinophytocola sp. TaxID=1872138 RepID=UPI002D7F06B5|nr:hypothetical protein [Actinophytocola sp.]HET9143568.1 hypothetical protein [Actinophytocola sp.]